MDDHKLERRLSDGHVASLGLRVDALERRMEMVEGEVRNTNREIAANTALTEEIHGKTEAMYELFDAAQRGFQVIASIGNGAARVGRGTAKAVDVVSKNGMRVLFVAGGGTGLWTLYKTGHFAWPDWILAIFK